MPKVETLLEGIIEPSIDRFADVRDLGDFTLEEELWLRKNGILVASHLDRDLLTGYEVDPVLESIGCLGDIHLVNVREGVDASGVRKHRLYTLERSGFAHALEVTDPAIGDARYVILSFPGFTETIEGPIRKLMQTELAAQFPDARIISVGSNGVGRTGSRYGWNERSLHGLNGMAEARLAVGRALGGILPIFVEETSMGSAVGQRLLHTNIYGQPEHGKLLVRGQLLLSPAIVDLRNVPRDMALRFIPGMIADLFKELALKTPPKETLHILHSLTHYGLSRGDIMAMGNQVLDLLRGTSESMYDDVVAHVPTIVVAGEKDSLAQWKMQERIRRNHPGQLDLHKIKRRGHGLGAKPAQACDKMRRVGQAMIERELGNTA